MGRPGFFHFTLHLGSIPLATFAVSFNSNLAVWGSKSKNVHRLQSFGAFSDPIAYLFFQAPLPTYTQSASPGLMSLPIRPSVWSTFLRLLSFYQEYWPLALLIANYWDSYQVARVEHATLSVSPGFQQRLVFIHGSCMFSYYESDRYLSYFACHFNFTLLLRF